MAIVYFIIIALVITLLIIAAILPGKFNIEHNAIIKRAAKDVINKVSDLNHFAILNSFEEGEAKGSFAIHGSPKCIGHAYSWKDQKVGTGILVITDINESHVYFDLQIIKPWKLRARSNWFFEEWGNGETKVIWQNHGNFSFPLTRLIGKIILRTLNHRSRMTLIKLKRLCET